jgi:molybdopterin converting factor small subunit
MKITVELTYDMAKVLGLRRFDLEDAATVAEALPRIRERFGDQVEAYEHLTRLAALVVNGVLIDHRRGVDTRLADGDTLAFLKAAAGG